jgi:hypothetical protein
MEIHHRSKCVAEFDTDATRASFGVDEDGFNAAVNKPGVQIVRGTKMTGRLYYTISPGMFKVSVTAAGKVRYVLKKAAPDVILKQHPSILGIKFY